ncbi:RPA family protein [Natronosalvus vescus]|uniref:RPA family protein n=1 Tax=Natronosalvus vescus TaxID=2953881 RepID=UPI0020906850|nr:hypothetical protein [Natronosalvus vescus]
MSADEPIPGREVAYRLFAAEFDDSTLSHTESDEERAPNYVVTPTGARLNRLFVVGALTEVTSVNDDMLRARVVDPTGAFVVYAGQYQPDALAFLERIEPPAFVSVTGKARTFQPEDSDVIYTSIRPESIATVDADTRDRWVVSAAEQTLERVGTYAAAAELDATGDSLADALVEAGVEPGLAAGIPLAQNHYGTTPAYLQSVRDLALEAARVVAGETDQVSGLDRQPDEGDGGATSSFRTLADAHGPPLPDDIVVAATPESDDAKAVEATDAGEATDAKAVEPTDAGEADAVESSTADVDTPSAEPGTESDVSDVATAETSGSDTEDDLGDFDGGGFDGEPTDAAEVDTEPSDDSADAVTTATESDVDDTVSETDSTSAPDEAANDLEGEDGSVGMYEMDDEEREQLEAEFGAEFSTGAEVDEAGEADIDVPDGDESGATDEPEAEAVEGDEPEAEVSEGKETGEVEENEEADLEDLDLQSLVVETMGELDEGDGADRSAVIDTVVDDTGADAEDVEAAIDDALMGGQCYEPGDDKLKAI